MTNLFLLESGRVTFSPIILLIPEFNKLWYRARNKERFNKEVAYIFFVADYNSDYNSYGLDKTKMIARDIMGIDNYKPDKLLEDCIIKYKELQRTPTLSLLESAYKSLDSIKLYFDSITINENDTEEEKEKKQFRFNIRDLISATKQLAEVCDVIKKLEDKVFKEELELRIQIRRGGNLNYFEDAKKAEAWLKTPDHEK